MQEEKFSLWEFLKFAVIAAAIVIPVRMVIAQPFIVSGHSMDPTFYDGDYLIIDELTYRFRQPEKNEVVVFRYPLDPSKFFIKRIEGLPGETVEYNGKKITLGPNQYYVLGDNRDLSSDSRIWGPVEEKFLVGRAILRLWPVQNMAALPGAVMGK